MLSDGSLDAMEAALSRSQLDLDRIAPALVLAHEHGNLGAMARHLHREVAAERMLRLRRGVYVWSSAWARLAPTERYLAFVVAVAKCSEQRPVLSHASAAAIHGLPIVGAWPHSIHQIVDPARGGRSDPGRVRHTVQCSAVDIEERDGLLVTTLARTLLDLASSAPVFTAVASIDAALHRPRYGGQAAVDKGELFRCYERSLSFRGARRALELIKFGDGGAESPHESNSRVTMARLGVAAPQLQHHVRIDGAEYDTDFYWRSADAVGEADGDGKYLDERMLAGRTTREVLLSEKRREDAIRGAVRGFTRWDYETGMSTVLLGARLAAIGVHREQPPRLLAAPARR